MTVPSIGVGDAPVVIVAFSPVVTSPMSVSNTFASTHTVERSAIVKAGVVPA